tara:strand:- start:1827 stop:2006 length:180 start_codon:yes stop_codon:yes gene_type:complete
MNNISDYLLSIISAYLVAILGIISMDIVSQFTTMFCQLIIAGATAYKIISDVNAKKKGE